MHGRAGRPFRPPWSPSLNRFRDDIDLFATDTHGAVDSTWWD